MKSFFNLYYNEICPTLKALDIMIKSKYESVDINELSYLLHITPAEINKILEFKHLSKISSEFIPTIMLNGSSYICKIFKKSLSYYNCNSYQPKDISYIYNIDIKKVEEAFKQLNLKEISSVNLSELFKLI